MIFRLPCAPQLPIHPCTYSKTLSFHLHTNEYQALSLWPAIQTPLICGPMLMYFYAFEQVLIPNVQFFLKKNLLRLFFTIKKVMGLLDKERKKSAISKSD